MLEKLRKLLVSFDAFDDPFQADVQSRLLLFPTDGFLLTPKQFGALGGAATQFGDSTGYCAITEGLEASDDQVALDYYEFNLHDYAGYRKLRDSGCVLQENALLSDGGSWIILVSQEFHALLGCPPDFLLEFKRLYPEADAEFDRFVDAWKSNAARIGSDIGWLPNLAAHLRSGKPVS
jgi:hypothetical protein